VAEPGVGRYRRRNYVTGEDPEAADKAVHHVYEECHVHLIVQTPSAAIVAAASGDIEHAELALAQAPSFRGDWWPVLVD
jgi:hypothetical protein